MLTRKISHAAALLLACLPLLLFAYLGLHTRMIHDDFGVAAVGLKYGPWDGLVHYYSRWTSAYSSIYLRLSLAEYAVAVPPLLTLAVIVIGLVGLYWLLYQICSKLELRGPRRLSALAASGLVLAAAINAFYTPESFFWYSASVQYTLPLVCLVFCLALAIWTIDKRTQDRTRLVLGASACALISFLTAGAAEMFLVFQVTFLTLLASIALSCAKGQWRRALAFVAGAMLIATAIGMLVQLSSPGIWMRMDADASNYSPPIRTMPLLVAVTIQITFESIGRPEVIAGFGLLFGLGVTLGLQTEPAANTAAESFTGKRVYSAAQFGFTLQALYLPILWAHVSDSPQFIGRYSASYMFVLAINTALLLLLLLAYWQRNRLAALVDHQERRHTIVIGFLLLAFLMLVALTQIRSIDARASTYLFSSALGTLSVLGILYRPEHPDFGTRALERAAVGTIVIGWVTIAALTFVTFIGHGFTSHRMMAGPALLQVAAGLFCGLYLGRLLKPGAGSRARSLASGGLALALVLGGGIFLGQARLVPDLQTYAREWDARHASIVEQRESGLTQIEVTPLSFDLADYIGMGTLRSAEQFYGVKSIEIVDA